MRYVHVPLRTGVMCLYVHVMCLSECATHSCAWVEHRDVPHWSTTLFRLFFRAGKTWVALLCLPDSRDMHCHCWRDIAEGQHGELNGPRQVTFSCLVVGKLTLALPKSNGSERLESVPKRTGLFACCNRSESCFVRICRVLSDQVDRPWQKPRVSTVGKAPGEATSDVRRRRIPPQTARSLS